MKIVYDEGQLKDYMDNAIDVAPDKPILIDRFLEEATEVEVDAVSDGE